MRAGAHDYILEDRLIRLTPALERELSQPSGGVRNERRTELSAPAKRAFDASRSRG